MIYYFAFQLFEMNFFFLKKHRHISSPSVCKAFLLMVAKTSLFPGPRVGSGPPPKRPLKARGSARSGNEGIVFWRCAIYQGISYNLLTCLGLC